MDLNSISRREFLRASGLTMLSLSMSTLKVKKVFAEQSSSGSEYFYRGWEDLYREQWTWDKVVRGTHYVNCWYQANCCFDLYIKDGLVVREEQAAEYPAIAPDVPDPNPRGCQKGSCYSTRMYSPTRIKYPLKRAGERGEGKWQRVSWDEVLRDIADAFIDVMLKEGPECIVWALGTQMSFGSQSPGFSRFSYYLGNIMLDMDADIADEHQGVAVTFGKIIDEGSADNWYLSDLVLIWGGNPIYTHIPQAHYITEGRYRGAKVVAICPDYNPSAIHADLWIPIKIGTDGALALSMAHVIIKEGLHKEDFIREQTDLPLLVRLDTKKFLREKDMKEAGQEDAFYFYDLTSQSVKQAPRNSLSLDGQKPALEGEYEVETLEGKVKVRPVFALVKEMLEAYPPQKASEITGVPEKTIVDLARTFAQSKTAINITQANFSKFYHGDLMERAMILIFALCGHFGKKGSGFRGFPFLHVDSFDPYVVMKKPGIEGYQELVKEEEPYDQSLREKGYTHEMIIYEKVRESYKQGVWVSAVLFWNLHGGLKELSGQSRRWDPYLKREVDEYIKESLEKGWQYINPPLDKEPKIAIEYGGNMVRRVRGYTKLIEHLFPKLNLLVEMDWRMNSTSLYADYVLPMAGWYEKMDVKWCTPLNPYLHLTQKAVEPLYESKSDWEFFCLLAKTLAERARERGISPIKMRDGREIDITKVYDYVSFDGYYQEKDEEKLARDYLAIATNLDKVDFEEIKKKGFVRLMGVGNASDCVGNATDIKPNETIVPFTWHTDKKIPYPTLSRRMQFYIDHPLYLELGEEMPLYKEPPKVGGDYPLILSGGHARWSIHSMWRDEALMLRLQRGVPVMYMSTKDAEERGIKDGDEVMVKNDIDSFTIQAKVAPSIMPGQLIIYHAWEKFQFKGGKLYQNLMPSPINPVELAGQYFHLRPMFLCLHPGQNDRETRVEVVKA